MTDGHLDLLELDAVRAGEATDDQRVHAGRCERCRAELAWISATALRIGRAARPPRSRRWFPFAAAAAAAVAALGLWIGQPSYAAEDIDRSGTVDILDAYALATGVGRGEARGVRDFNHDGVVDSRDVDWVARKGIATSPYATVRQEGAVRFVVVDIYVDSGESPLAAWQFELACGARIVGIEGAKEPPYYDPAALEGGRVVVASFGSDPSRGRVRVARLHVQETGAGDYAPKLVVAGDSAGARIEARIEAVRAGGDR